jgi:uncharacterized RmlC-like cupin family protein
VVGVPVPQDPLTHVPAGRLQESDPTPGMLRRQAVGTGTMWAGAVATEPGAVSGWHHHGEHESTIYVVRGRLRMEFGPGGADTFDAVAGDFVHVPADAVHRESNPEDDSSHIVVVRCGEGEPTVNVSGPA